MYKPQSLLEAYYSIYQKQENISEEFNSDTVIEDYRELTKKRRDRMTARAEQLPKDSKARKNIEMRLGQHSDDPDMYKFISKNQRNLNVARGIVNAQEKKVSGMRQQYNLLKNELKQRRKNNVVPFRRKMQEEYFDYIADYLLENYEFDSEEHFYAVISSLDEETIYDILAETAEKDHPDIKGQDDFQRRVEAEMARRRAARAKKQQSNSDSGKKEEPANREQRWERFQRETGAGTQSQQKKVENPLRKTTMNTQGSSQRKKGPDLPNFRR